MGAPILFPGTAGPLGEFGNIVTNLLVDGLTDRPYFIHNGVL
jgi:hypothetical protein